MKGRNSLNSKEREISLLAKIIKLLKEDDYENDLQSLKNELAIKTYDKEAYNQKIIFYMTKNIWKKKIINFYIKNRILEYMNHQKKKLIY